MKSLLLASILCLSSVALIAQNETSIIGVNEAHNETDTTRTFTIGHKNKDACREALVELWGEPTTDETGTMRWLEVSVDGLESPVTIELLDGIFEIDRKKRRSKFTVFKDEKHKAKTLESGGNRYMVIEFKNKAGDNIINSQEREVLIKNLLKNTLRDI